ncbi:2-methylcitrate dehydratase PrpD [Parasphingorhabdus marina DSM 22363]|uniref:2-methylcitrate dehydratase PrpD n=1 Tax=Parasphingorhabdus marina DSM 22363 TaxID=1123272 RepID=A0A1N6CMC7_9SPHN|nr:MmgE/PrpD family protein [Parasphingorhabdus marina]SIN59758.1 2-methylcitrate dehydratase PrpD [Parasphingorhabdus marina DSM 22363]
MSATQDILAFAAAEHILPDSTIAAAQRLFADTLAGGAAGAASDEAQAMLDAVRGWGQGDEARLLGLDERLPAPSAAWFNGFAIHCLEWDAVHEPAVVHAMSVVTAALLASADRRNGCDEAAFLTALAVGVDIASGLGVSASGAMSFFRPATAGVIGAALAAARLEGLSSEQFADVMGLAYSQAAGTMQAHVEASIALPLQIANAARAAIAAVDLVKAGMNGPHDVLEGPFGYFQLIEPGDLSGYVAGLGQRWLIEEVSIKPFPSGRASHGILGAIDNLLRDDALEPADVESIEIAAPPLIHRLVGRPYKRDMTPAYARLCLPFLVPLMLRDGIIDPRCFTPEHFADPALMALGEKVSVRIDDNPDHNALAPQQLTIRSTAGFGLTEIIEANLGSPVAPMSDAQTRSKRDLARSLAAAGCDARIFDNPLAYATESP